MDEIRKDFLFITNGEISFLQRSLKELLETAEFSTDKCNIDMSELGKREKLGTINIVDAELLIENSSSRVLLCDQCIEQGAILVLIGDADKISALSTLVTPSIIGAAFLRPINNKEVVKKLSEIMESIRKKGLRKKILIVDDSPVFLRTASEWLEDTYSVSICPSATAAFHMIEVFSPDLILLDYEMPVCDGAQFLKMLHSETVSYDIPVMFLTSRGDAATVKEVLELKPQGYLLKSQPKEKILEALDEYFIKEKMK